LESLSFSERKVTDLSADRARLTKSLSKSASKISDLKADVSAWKVHFEEADLKISRLEKELESQEDVNKLLSADIEALSLPLRAFCSVPFTLFQFRKFVFDTT